MTDADPYADTPHMTEHELVEAAYELTGGNIADLSSEKIQRLMTVTQYVTDICLNEIERRGELAFQEGMPVVPYVADHGVETVLTRPERV